MADRLRIALADDDESVRDWLAEALRSLGHEVEAVDGGDRLVELCRTRRPDLVVSDLQMPGTDGLAAAEIAVVRFGIPAILLSAGWEPETLARAERAGIRCLPKPVPLAALARAVEHALRTPRRSSEESSAVDNGGGGR